MSGNNEVPSSRNSSWPAGAPAQPSPRGPEFIAPPTSQVPLVSETTSPTGFLSTETRGWQEAHRDLPADQAPARAVRGQRHAHWIVGVAALVVIALAVGGWLVWRPHVTGGGGTSPAPTESSAPTPVATAETTLPPGPVTVPFNPTEGGYDGTRFFVLGVWSGVAVLHLMPATGSVVRGVDVTTGAVLWTLDTLPDGGHFTVDTVAVWNDRLAVGLRPPASTEPTSVSTNVVVLILGLRTGDLVTSQAFPIKVTGGGTQVSTFSYTLAAYRDGIVVLDGTTVSGDPNFSEGNSYDWQVTVAYADTDLQTPLWQVDKVEHPGLGPERQSGVRLWANSDEILAGRWVLAADWTYVSIQDGQPTSLTLYDGRYNRFFTLGDAVVETSPDATDQVGQTLALWTGPDAPKWSYDPRGTQPDLIRPEVACGSASYLIARQDHMASDGFTPISSQLIALRTSDGVVAWSIPYTPDPDIGATRAPCTVIGRGDQEIVVVSAGTEVELLDATDGRLLGRKPALIPPSSSPNPWIDRVVPCAAGLACAWVQIWPDNVSSLTAFDIKDGQGSSPWSVQVDAIDGPFRMESAGSHLVLLIREPDMGYAWMIA